MAVYKRSYKRYDGPVTPAWSRFLVLTRYALQTVFSSKFVLVLYVASFVPALVFGAIIYFHHSTTLLELFRVDASQLIPIDGTFFYAYCISQAFVSYALAALIGPGLIAPDLANSALPLYLCRPLSRADYVMGKMSVLVILLSFVTWVPGLILMIMHAGYGGFDWLWTEMGLVLGVLLISATCIAITSLLALAVSAWVKWRIIAAATIAGIPLVMGAFGAIFNESIRTDVGDFVNVFKLFRIVMNSVLLDAAVRNSLPAWAAWGGLAAIAGVCLLVLNRRLRAYEVIR